MARGLKDDLPDGESENTCDTSARRANHLAIPEAAPRLSGIHLSRRSVAQWTPGSPLSWRPGMAAPRRTARRTNQLILAHPKTRQRGFKPPTDAHGCYFRREPRRIIGLDRDAGERRRPQRRLEARCRNTGREAPHRFVLLHANDRVVVAGHPGVGHIGGAGGENLMVGRRHMGVGADHKARPAVAEIADRLLFARRLAMEID